MQILTHRGLEPLNAKFAYSESSKEAFEDQLKRGFGLEFDINFGKDNFPFIFHESNLSRISQGQDNSYFADLSKEEILSYPLPNNGHLIGFEELIKLIDQYRKPGEMSALHLKSKFQERAYVDICLKILQSIGGIEEKIFIFDLKTSTAQYIRKYNKNIKLFPSISHPYDVKRYGECVGGTLLSIEEVLQNRGLWNGAWLDEWDTNDEFGKKKLYTKEVFSILRKEQLLIGLVTPELHAKSPGLLGNESHADCKNTELLKARIKEIIALEPDFICSDYLEYLGNYQ